MDKTLKNLNNLSEKNELLTSDSDDDSDDRKPRKSSNVNRRVNFTEQLEQDKSERNEPNKLVHPKSILRNKGFQSPINEELVKEMDNRETKKLVPMNDQVKMSAL